MANKRRVKSRNITVQSADLSKMVDVLVIGLEGEYLGEVLTKASPAGREAVEKLFPGTHIEWRDDLGPDATVFPNDWKEFSFVIPGLLRDLPRFGLKHTLPQRLLDLRPIDELSPDQFAALMMFGVNNQGVRSAMWSLSKNQLEIVNVPSTFN